MNNNNPYSPPRSDVTPPSLPSGCHGERLAEPRSLPASVALSWLSDSWALVKGDLGLWVLIVLTVIAIHALLGFVPVLGDVVASLIGPIITGGLLMGLRAVDQGESLRFDHLFDGFRYKFLPLLGVGALTLGVMVLVVLLFAGMFVAVNLDAMRSSTFDPENWLNGVNVGFIALGVVLFLAFSMLFWFATQLVALGDVPVFAALGLSIKACLRNPLALLLYVLLLLVGMLLLVMPPLFFLFWQISAQGSVVLMVLAGLLVLVEMLVLAPWLVASTYVSYKQVFLK